MRRTHNGNVTPRRMWRWATLALVVMFCGQASTAWADQGAAPPAINNADTAWMLIATALVLLMTPALAFFYGGLVRSKNALKTMMMSFMDGEEAYGHGGGTTSLS